MRLASTCSEMNRSASSLSVAARRSVAFKRRRVEAVGNRTQCRFGELAGQIRRELPDRSQRYAPSWCFAAAAGPVFHDIGFFARRPHPQPKTL